MIKVNNQSTAHQISSSTCFPGKDAKPEEYDINMRRNDVYDDI